MAKNTIVIRSVIVPLANLGSNFLQLMTNGVGVRDIAKGFPEKLVEIDQHLKNLARKVEIEADMARYHGREGELRKLRAELKSLEDSSRRMSIWPLIEAGEFSTISEGLTEADAAIGQGKWVEWMTQKVDRAPSQFGTLGRYAIVSRDTALFKGMSRAVHVNILEMNGHSFRLRQSRRCYPSWYSSPRTVPNSSRCSRSASCSWSEGGCWREDDSVRNLPNRRYDGQETAK